MDLFGRQAVDDLVDRALAVEPSARPAFVRREAGNDAALLAVVNAVLAEADPADGFLAPGGALSGPLASDLARDGTDGEVHPPVLERGACIAGYEVRKLAGRGGMGEVYRARDTRLGRQVALKLLPDRFASDPHRLARLEREARVLAALNHPRIASIHGIAEEGDLRALVLEWVEGQTLAERLAAGPLPCAEALRIAMQIAEALEAAHQSAIVHRDLKPSNVALTAAGAKVLDFGLARALGPDDAGGVDPLSAAREGPGLVLGTPAYMSPEQARGERVDHRADIWAFGCVLVELLTGRRAFSSSGPPRVPTDGEPDAAIALLAGLPGDTPPSIRALVERCLVRDPRRRLGWIGEAATVLEEALARGTALSSAPRQRWRHWPVLAALAVGALGAVAVDALLRPAAPALVTRLAIPIPAGDVLVAGDLPTLALSPDGRHVVYRARRAGTLQLFHRALDRAEPQPIAGSEHAMAPFFSPDATWVAFSRDGALLKVPVAGGNAVVICKTTGAVTGAWAPGDQVVFGGEFTTGLMRVPASGSTPARVTTVDGGRGEVAHGAPQVLGDRRLIAFTIWSRSGSEIAVVPLDGGTPDIVAEGRQPRFVPPHHLAFIRQNALWAARLDRRGFALTGSPGPAIENVDVSAVSGNAHFDVSASGALAYLPRRTARSRDRALAWIDGSGREQPVPLEPRPYTRAAVSPDGSRIALAVTGPETRDLWLYTIARGTLTRLTFDDPVDTAPVWTPDGRNVVFRSDREGGGMYVVNADGAASARLVTAAPAGTIHTPYDVTRDGQQVIFTAFRTYRDQGIGMVPLDGRGAITWLVDGPFAELRPRLSPDGRWIAYQSDETGRFEVYVRPFPRTTSARWQVSTAGGVSPAWGREGREILYYVDDAVMRVPLGGGPTFRAGTPARLFGLHLPGDRLGPTFDVSPDGRRFLIVKADDDDDEGATRGPLLLVDHWREELSTRFPAP